MTNSQQLDAELLLSQTSWVRSLARSLVRGDDVDDLVQDTWRAALERPPNVEDERGLRAWLRRVTTNLAIDRRRTATASAWRATHTQRVEREDPERPDEAAERVALQQKLVQAVLALEEPHRAAVIWRYVDGLDAVEIARRQGVTPAAARKRVSRGLAALRERFDREHRGGRAEWCALLANLGEPQRAPFALSGAWLVAAGTVLAFIAGGFWWWSPGSRSANVSTQVASPATGTTGVSTSPDDTDSAPLARAGIDVERAAAPALRGRVLDVDGTSEVGARVVIYTNEFAGFAVGDLETTRQRREVGAVSTDATGAFAFTCDPDRVYDLEVLVDDRLAAFRYDWVVGLEATIPLEAPGKLVGVVVRSRDEKPLAGARVEARDRSARPSHPRARVHTAITDGEGRFGFAALPPSDYQLHVRVDGEPSPIETARVSAGETTERRLVVPTGREVRGRVISADGGRPIVSASLRSASDGSEVVSTDTEGRFELAGLPVSDETWMQVSASGYGRKLVSIVPQTDAIEIQLESASTWSGRVRTVAGAPIEGAYVAAVARDMLEADRRRGMMQTDWCATHTTASGEFELADVRSDLTHLLFVRKPGFGARWIEVPKQGGAVRDLADITLATELRLEGRVVDADQQPVRGVRVTLAPTRIDDDVLASFAALMAGSYRARATMTDDAGGFRIGELARGTYELSAALSSDEAGGTAQVVVTDVTVREPFVLTLERGRAIVGRVTDESGRAIDALVSLHPAGGGGSAVVVQTDASGQFRAERLEPGEYVITVVAQTTDAAGRPVFASAQVGPHRPGWPPFGVTLRPGVWLRGRVLDAAGQPVENAEVRIRRAIGPSGDGVDVDRTDRGGTFELLVPPDRPVNLRVTWLQGTDSNQAPTSSGGARTVDLEVAEPGASTVEIRFP